MLYYAPFNNTVSDDARFTSRGAAGHMQGPVSRMITEVVPEARQIAYSVYKDNIDIFLAATALKRTVPISSGSCDVEFIAHTFPLSYPKTVVSFKLKKEHLDIAMKILRDHSAEVTKIEGMPKFPDAYALESPDIRSLMEIAPAAGPSPVIGGTCGVKSTLALSKVFQAVELYMRTNTYPAYSSNESAMDVPVMNMKRAGTFRDFYDQIGKHPKTRYSSMDYKHAEDPNKGKSETGMWIGESEAAQVLDFDNGVNQTVTARPGPLKNTSWGTPASCAAKPGIAFEYFEGMNSPDKAFMQTMMVRLFFRSFGKDPQDKYLAFRDDIQSAANTSSGLALTHMLKGIEISLDAQGQFFAMFDGKAYLGFVVLGAKWRIRWGMKWIVPLSVTDLQEELSKIKTHTSSLAEVALELNAAGLMIDEADINTGVKLAEHLALVTWEGSEVEIRTAQKKLERLIGRLDFGTRKTGFAIETFLKALEDLEPSASLEGQHVTFPSPSEYPLFKERVAVVLSRFGYKIPSFAIYKGQDAVYVNKETGFGLGPETEAGKTALGKVSKVMVAEKPFSLAVKDFQAFMEDPKVYQNSGERSGSYQNHSFKGPRKDLLIQKLHQMTKGVVPKVKDAKGKKKEEVFVEDAFFAALKRSVAKPVSRAPSRSASVAPVAGPSA